MYIPLSVQKERESLTNFPGVEYVNGGGYIVSTVAVVVELIVYNVRVHVLVDYSRVK